MTGKFPTKAFRTAEEWRQWLAKNHAKSAGVWLRIFKKNSGKDTVSYAEALDDALCFGWIDGQKDAYDAASHGCRNSHRADRKVCGRSGTGNI
jgi:uncharacterized protein YdeI (YjbR/CyaY-like superfamily)